jgi:hypothetical protein
VINFTAWEHIGVCVVSDGEESPCPGTSLRRDPAGSPRPMPTDGRDTKTSHLLAGLHNGSFQASFNIFSLKYKMGIIRFISGLRYV